MYVSAEIMGGLGNNFFQVAAMLGYSEQYGHKAVFVKKFFIKNPHPGPKSILDFFPNIPVIETMEDYVEIKEKTNNAFSYNPLPYQLTNVKLFGYFQSEKYFPSYRIYSPLLPKENQFHKTIFLHVRRGDYLLNSNRFLAVDLTEYYTKALRKAMQPNMYILVCSNDMAWCKENLPKQNAFIDKNQWIWFEGDDLETLRAMMKCEYGGICANSTFSWWGAYLNRSSKKQMYMPKQWTNEPQKNSDDIYPKGTIVL